VLLGGGGWAVSAGGGAKATALTKLCTGATVDVVGVVEVCLGVLSVVNGAVAVFAAVGYGAVEVFPGAGGCAVL
jgi:hypothetical protein